MISRLARSALFAVAAAYLFASFGSSPASARSVGWCSSNGGSIERVSSYVTGVIIDWGYDNLVRFDGGRNSAQDCWNAAVSWLANDMGESPGDSQVEMCDAYPYPYAVDSQFHDGVSFEGQLLGYPIGRYYCN
jgi:hypothetical protein